LVWAKTEKQRWYFYLVITGLFDCTPEINMEDRIMGFIYTILIYLVNLHLAYIKGDSMTFCIHCGAALLEDARFCFKCGKGALLSNAAIKEENDSSDKNRVRMAQMKYNNEQRIREEEREDRAEENDFATLHGVGGEVAKLKAKYKDVTHIDESSHIDRSTKISDVRGPVFSNVEKVGTVVSGDMHVGLDEKRVGQEVGKQIDSLKEDPQKMFKRGTAALFQGDYENAIVLFERSLQLNPDAFQPRRFLALSYMADQRLKYMALNDVQQAENHILQCLNQKRDDSLSLILLAALKHDYYIENTYSQGEPRFEQIIDRLKDNHLPEKDRHLLEMMDFSRVLKRKLNL